MYSIVLMAALSNGALAPAAHEGPGARSEAHFADHGHRLDRHRRGGCHGGCGGLFGGRHGCHGGCYGYTGGCHGYYGGCYGGYGGCYGSYGGWRGGCYGGYGSCYGGYGGWYQPAASYGCYGSGPTYTCYGGTPSSTTGGVSSAPLYRMPEGPGTGTGTGARERIPAPGTGPAAQPASPPAGTRKPEGAEARASAPAYLIVSLPASAKLTVEGAATRSTGAERVFISPPLTPGRDYVYTLQAELTADGKPIRVGQEVSVRAGESRRVRLDFPQGVAAR